MDTRDEDNIQTRVSEITKAALDDAAKGQYLTGRQMWWFTTVSGTAIGLLIVVMGIISFN